MIPLARALLLATLILAPLAFGAVQPWAWGAMTVAVGCMLVFWAAGCVQTGTVALLWSPLYLPAFALLVLAMVQLRFGLTLDRMATREALIKLLSCLSIFFLSQQLYGAASRQAWRMTAIATAVYAFAMAVFATIQFFARPGLLYGVIAPRTGGGVFGPYVNYNHYAGLMELLVPLGAAFAVSLPPKHPAKPFALFAMSIALGSVLLCGSRSGAIAVLVEALLFSAAVALARPAGLTRGMGAAMIGIALLVAVFVCWLVPTETSQRWKLAADSPKLAMGGRDGWTRSAVRMSVDHLACGVGLGAFEMAYPRYQTEASDVVVDYAHDDYAQLFAETGILGWILVPLSVVLLLRLSFGRLHLGPGEPAAWLRLGAATGVCGILVHSFSDFNLHIPANAAWFCFSAGLAVLPETTSLAPIDAPRS